MGLNRVETGLNVPEDFNVIIEIPMLADPIKYEVDKKSGALVVDRFMSTSMHYPCNYGYVPGTLCGDGDPLDVLVLTPVPLMMGVIVRARPIGLLRMQDEHGEDAKVLAVPVKAVCGVYDDVQSTHDLPALQLRQIEHFFQHYKDLEAGKFVRLLGWGDPQEARVEILRGVHAYRDAA
ncbi:MAG: inorganic diphosphatase [Burkholderiales bacterium]|nr:inorganic diphosphatase [Burkholderiales bacterium]OJX05540.1 MAG: inorganic pyrophosphatase [Burkholderiales bacterium 70-64]